MENEKKRELWIDYCKVFLIYLMVVAHSGHIPTSVDTFICSFHMPAFLLISGYLYKPNNDIKASLLNNVKRLLIPALFFSVVCSLNNDLHLYHTGALTVETAIIQPLLGLFFYDRVIGYPACGVIWFVVVLFMSKITLDILLKYTSAKVTACFVIVVACAISLVRDGSFTYLYYIERWMVSLPIVYAGYLLKSYGLLDVIQKNKYKYAIWGVFYSI